MRYATNTELETARVLKRRPPMPGPKRPLENLENQREETSVKSPNRVVG